MFVCAKIGDGVAVANGDSKLGMWMVFGLLK